MKTLHVQIYVVIETIKNNQYHLYRHNTMYVYASFVDDTFRVYTSFTDSTRSVYKLGFLFLSRRL